MKGSHTVDSHFIWVDDAEIHNAEAHGWSLVTRETLTLKEIFLARMAADDEEIRRQVRPWNSPLLQEP